MRSPSRSKSRDREDRYTSSSRRRSRSRSKEKKREKVEERSSRKERDERDRDSRREKDRKEKVHETKDRDGKSSSRRTVVDEKVRRRREKRSRSRSRGKEVSKSERDKEKSSKRKNVGRGSPAVLKSNEEPSEKKPKVQKIDDKQPKLTNENDAVYGPISSEEIEKRIVSDSEPVQESLEDLFTTAKIFVSQIKTENENGIKQENIVESKIEVKGPGTQIVPTKIESLSDFKDDKIVTVSKEPTPVFVDRKSSSKSRKEKSKKRDKKKKKSSKSSKKRKRAESSSSSSPSVSSDTDEGSPEA
uniref:Uncharacterized protein n=1 Tax=Romanomermis culicivorax TaxID=13658 RepID=A0A915J8E9_ROMCU